MPSRSRVQAAVEPPDGQHGPGSWPEQRRAGRAVPGQVSVVGFEGRPVAQWFDLTTVAQSPARTGREAGVPAPSLIDHPGAGRERHVVPPTRVIPRATTAPPPAAHVAPGPRTAVGLTEIAVRRCAPRT
ncbi:substrate-binding domain-containing protein [Streptomyces sp. NRRL S-481]|uniref:substrate-binding domain-containing protein n=1 Tax=Streptomyces sp. NRRL S-481 TaxID=1463911 RepID=UPI001F2A8A9A|nr:substrate-binding domain-containing protein [Streptomyces sp. NRRL S-481]